MHTQVLTVNSLGFAAARVEATKGGGCASAPAMFGALGVLVSLGLRRERR